MLKRYLRMLACSRVITTFGVLSPASVSSAGLPLLIDAITLPRFCSPHSDAALGVLRSASMR